MKTVDGENMEKHKLEQISALMDEQLEIDEQEAALDQLLSDAEVQKVWQEYYLIRDCLQNRQAKLGFDVKHSLFEQLKQEARLYVPKTQQKRSWRGYAVAASVAAVSLAIWQVWPTLSQEKNNAQMAQVAPQNEAANQSLVNKTNKDRVATLTVTVNPNEPLRVNSYLRAHQEAMGDGLMSASLQEGIQ